MTRSEKEKEFEPIHPIECQRSFSEEQTIGACECYAYQIDERTPPHPYLENIRDMAAFQEEIHTKKADKLFSSLGLSLPHRDTLIRYNDSIAYKTDSVKYNLQEAKQAKRTRHGR